MNDISLFGYGKTTKAIADIVSRCKIYDDSIKEITKKDNHTIYPSFMFDPKESMLEIPSPGIPPYNDMIKKAKNLVSDYDFFYQQSKNRPFNIWISGTNGKTTVTKMIGHLLRDKGGVIGGNVGTPLAELPDTGIHILETSSFTLHYTNVAKPDMYILLPVSEDHISWHGSFKKYKKAKLKPLKFLKEGEAVILPKEFKDTPTNGFKIAYEDSNNLAKYFDIDIKKINFDEPFLFDAVVALGVTKILFDEIDYELINSFRIDPHRLEEIKDKKGRLWINDSKGTNLHATANAIKRYKDKTLHLILGGDDKGADLTPLFELLKDINVYIYAVGSNKDKIIGLSKSIDKNATKCETLKEVISTIDKIHDSNSVALLSPAASSLDEYPSYKDRGNLFKELVADLS
jgi:UDP-N-acetylmuramoylalanine--D-glutamate ligase